MASASRAPFSIRSRISSRATPSPITRAAWRLVGANRPTGRLFGRCVVRLFRSVDSGHVAENCRRPNRPTGTPVALTRWRRDAVAGTVEPRDRVTVNAEHPGLVVDHGSALRVQ